MQRIGLKYKGPKCKNFGDWLLDFLKMTLVVFFPFLFKVRDSDDSELEL